MTAIVNETVSVKKKPSGRRGIFASAFGNALEFFDFGVYNFFVVYISTLFFPPSADHNVAVTGICNVWCELFYASARWDYRWCLGRSLRA